ncbi:MAG: DUF4352 domain-containing protein [Candidatus Micrarchaeota archaeon]
MAKKAPEIQPVQNSVRKIGVLSVLGFLFGSVYILAGLGTLLTSLAGGLLLILAGIVIIPIFNVFLLKRFHFILSAWLRIVISVILLLSAAVAMFPYQEFADSMNANATTKTPIYSLGEKFMVGSMQLTVPLASKADFVLEGKTGKEARIGAVFYVFEVTVENQGKGSVSFGTSNLKVRDENSREFDVGGCEDKLRGGKSIGERIEPGLSADYINCYVEVPENTKVVLLEINEGYFSGVGARVDLSRAETQNIKPLGSSPKPTARAPSTKALEVTLNSVSFSDQINGSLGMQASANEGNIFLIADITVENAGKEAATVGGQQFKVKDSESYSYSLDLGANMIFGQSIEGNLPPGDKIRGKIPFQVPKAAKGLQLIFDTGETGHSPLKFDIG